jgi:hypothetical protein
MAFQKRLNLFEIGALLVVVCTAIICAAASTNVIAAGHLAQAAENQRVIFRYQAGQTGSRGVSWVRGDPTR